MTKQAVVIRHVAFEDLGIFDPVLREQDYDIRYSEAGIDNLRHIEDPDLLVVLGGPIGVYEESLYPFLSDELVLLATRLNANRPTLGICLGAQLMARALGAGVYPGRAKEIGWKALRLSVEGEKSPLRHFDGLPVLHWHGDTFDLPAGAVQLASTDICDNQAFAIGHHALAFQFHPEVVEAGFERWLIGHACEIAATPNVEAPDIRRDTAQYAQAASQAGQACLTEWLAEL